MDSSSSGSSTDSTPDMGRIATAGASSANVPSARAARTRTHPIEDHRTETHRLQHVQTVGASIKTKAATRLWPDLGGGKPYPPDLPPQEEYVVEFDWKDDPLRPQNW